MKYALAFAGLVAGALAGGECYAPPPAPSSYATPSPTPAPGSDYFGVISSRSLAFSCTCRDTTQESQSPDSLLIVYQGRSLPAGLFTSSFFTYSP